MPSPGTHIDLHMRHLDDRRPFTRHEPLVGKRGHYPHPTTVRGMRAWREEWQADGSIRLAAPVALEVYVRCLRPASHLTKAGELAAAGRRAPWPGGWDLSNVVKLIEDALKGHAFEDDAEITTVFASKRWVTPASPLGNGTFVTLRSVTVR